MTNEMTIDEIAERHGLNADYVSILSRMKGFPDPTRRIGRNKMYDAGIIAKFFKDREKNKRKRTA